MIKLNINIHQAPQGSEEWHLSRAGKITASMFSVARERLKKSGEFSEAAKNYAFRLAVEQISGLPMDEGFQTWQMRRGTELEPVARSEYEIRTGRIVMPAGFISSECGRFGASADGFADDRGIEIKCLVSPEKVRQSLLDNDVSPWMDQVQGGMWITGLEQWDFMIYCPMLSSINRDLTIWTVKRDDDYIGKLVSDLLEFNGLVEEFKHKLGNQS